MSSTISHLKSRVQVFAKQNSHICTGKHLTNYPYDYLMNSSSQQFLHLEIYVESIKGFAQNYLHRVDVASTVFIMSYILSKNINCGLAAAVLPSQEFLAVY